MQGRRVYPDQNGHLFLKPGDYGKTDKNVWIARTPNGAFGFLVDHIVVEHEDKTITVNPSIVVDDDEKKYHGYLERGIWREV